MAGYKFSSLKKGLRILLLVVVDAAAVVVLKILQKVLLHEQQKTTILWEAASHTHNRPNWRCGNR